MKSVEPVPPGPGLRLRLEGVEFRPVREVTGGEGPPVKLYVDVSSSRRERDGEAPLKVEEAPPDVVTFPPLAPGPVVGTDDHHPMAVILVSPHAPTPGSLVPSFRLTETDVEPSVGAPPGRVVELEVIQEGENGRGFR